MEDIIIAGASTYGVKNMGDDAMFKNLVDSIKREVPDCKITFLARHPDKYFDEVYGVKSIKNLDHDTKKDSIGRFFFGFNRNDPFDHLVDIRNAISECDLIILGGNLFMEVSENTFLRGVASYTAFLAMTAKMFQKPYSIYGMSVLPYKLDYTKEITRFVVTNAQIVTVREEYHKNNLREINVPVGNVHVVSDPAFGLDAVGNKRRGEQILKTEGINFNDGPIIGINFRAMYYKWTESDLSKFSDKMAKLCNLLIEQINANLLLIPNCFYDTDTRLEDDRYPHEVLRGKVKNKEKITSIVGDWMMPDIFSIFPLLDMYISNRRHGCAFAAIHNIPFLAMSTGKGYIGHWHLLPFMKSFDMEDQLVSLTNDSFETIKNKAMKTWEIREELSKKLENNIPKMKIKAREYIKLILTAYK